MADKRKKKTPYQRIMEASRANRGIRLSATEVALLAADDAISHCADNDDEGGAWEYEDADTNDMVFRPYRRMTP